MNKRERVMAILDHQPADKIPVDCGAMHSSGISAITYNALKKELQIHGGETKVYDIPPAACHSGGLVPGALSGRCH